MAKKRKTTLADHVEATERRDAPRAQARAARTGTWGSISMGLVALAVVLAAGAIAYLRFKRII